MFFGVRYPGGASYRFEKTASWFRIFRVWGRVSGFGGFRTYKGFSRGFDRILRFGSGVSEGFGLTGITWVWKTRQHIPKAPQPPPIYPHMQRRRPYRAGLRVRSFEFGIGVLGFRGLVGLMDFMSS